MCEIVEIGLKGRNKNITIEYERDASLRATEIIIVNNGQKGEYGLRLTCLDTGEIRGGYELTDGTDIVV